MSYYQQVGQRVSQFFMGGGGGRQQQQGFNNMDGGQAGGWGGGYGGQQQQQMGSYPGQGQYGQQYDQRGGMQGGGGGMQGGGGGMQGGYNMQNNGGGMEFNMGGRSQQQQMGGGGGGGGNFQFTPDMPSRPKQQKQTSGLNKPSMTPGVRRNQGFQCSTPLWLALVAILVTIFASALTAGLVVDANKQFLNKFTTSNANSVSPPLDSTTSPSSTPAPTPVTTKSPTTRAPTTRAPTPPTVAG